MSTPSERAKALLSMALPEDASERTPQPCKVCRETGGVHPHDGWCSGCRMAHATHRNTYPAMVPAGQDFAPPSVRLREGCVTYVREHWQQMGWPVETIITEPLVPRTVADVGPAIFATLTMARGA